jgi:hypothetical protein
MKHLSEVTCLVGLAATLLEPLGLTAPEEACVEAIAAPCVRVNFADTARSKGDEPARAPSPLLNFGSEVRVASSTAYRVPLSDPEDDRRNGGW